MSKEQRNVPKLRFPEFTGDWEQRKLEDEFAEFIVPMRDKPKEFGGTIPWTRIEDIEGKYLNGTLSGQYVSEETIRKMNLKIIPKDSLIVSSSATFGVVAVVTQDLITNQTFIGLVPKDKDTIDYWYSYFQSDEARRYMKLQSAGSTIFYISRESFENMPITLPSKEEAIKIGEFLTNIDNTITLQQRKLDQIKEYKKGMLQKMFPKEGESVPEVRFQGFTGEWEQRKLEDVYSERNERGNDSLPILSVSIHSGVSDGELEADNLGKVVRRSADKSTYKHVYSGDLVFNMMRAWQGAIGVVKNEGMVSPAYISAIPNKEVFPLFMNHLLRRKDVIDQINSLSYGVTDFRKRLYWDSFVKVTCYIPTKEEQRYITEFLDNLNNLITLHQRKLDAMKEYKKGLLQQMFV